ncbi:N-acetylmuramoyl-L-alanine amidase [Cereibacter sphaeroides]|uniref:N-acetylmuramoyl-L-alanine amidase n=1 Tax=Cereibacter sphaeroides TaxID=1063 RepID=UPI000F534BB8|nr:N-acetylmuramoyl-L-alanine amidase [Cereibacter sphaeroides]AZB57247.1 N-acetylmuramoyl-L-alanine amidase [Cereibacter sphaeroides]AZB61531.1 N-acetylmuramoyl-L-alanine amidase [Cereibacter sphaeroides]
MRIEHHRLTDVPFQQARHIGREIVPTLVILHDTASRLTPGSAAAYLAENAVGVSVHFVVERDGTIVQQVPTNRRAGHAGKSSFHGRAGCNDFSIGIEIVNPGRMTRLSESQAVTWYGEIFAISLFGIREVETPEHGRGLWMPYAEAQITAVLELLRALFEGVPTLRDIATHWYVSPGRKVDTNPLFPLEHVRARILGRDDPADAEAEAFSEPVTPTPANSKMVVVETAGDALNLRRWPSFNPNILARIPDGTPVPVLRQGRFDGRQWLQVAYAGQEGWIVAAYTAALLPA